MNWLAAGLMACLVLGQDPNPRKPAVTIRVDTLFPAGAGANWHTFILEVTNQTASDQEFRISLDLERTDRAVRREKFAPKVRKRLFLYLPAENYTYRVRIKVEDASGREVLSQDQEMSFSPHSSHGGPRMVAALMDRTPAQVPSGSIVKLIPEELFPDRWIGLDGITHVIIRDYKFDALLPAQRAALVEWVRRGGHAVLYAGSNRDWLTSPGVQELAPVMLGESTEVESIPDMERRFRRFREQAKFAHHKFLNGEPLPEHLGGAVRFSTGRGRVIVVPFDLERAPFDSWPGTMMLRGWLAGDIADRSVIGASVPRDNPRLSSDIQMIHRAATIHVNRLPPFLLLLILTALYVIAVGPVNFLVLRRLRMTVRLVFTIPAISALFLGVVVVSGYVLKGTSTVTFDVAVLDTTRGSGIAYERHYLSVFAPMPQNYDIAFGTDETGAPANVHNSYEEMAYRRGRDDSESGGVTYDQTDRWTLKGVPFQQWQTRAFAGDAVRSIDGGVTFRYDGELEVTNRTSYTIRRGWAVDKETVFQACPFGEVPPGATRRFPMTPDPEAHRRYDWLDASTLEQRLVAGWLFTSSRLSSFRPTLLCVLDRLPDEISIDARRSSESQRLCLLQVGSEP